jgi:hypothetical protein
VLRELTAEFPYFFTRSLYPLNIFVAQRRAKNFGAMHMTPALQHILKKSVRELGEPLAG